MPTIITEGAATARGYGFAARSAAGPVYIEDVFSTYVYSGTGATQTITNNINLSANGGLVWTKRRDTAGYGNYFIDTARGATKTIDSTSNAAEVTYADSLTAFTTSGYTLGADAANGGFNNGAGTYVGWTFRKQSKFFDIVTYTGTGVARTIAHNLGSAPRFMIIKSLNVVASWATYHADLGANAALFLNTTAGSATSSTYWNSTNPNATVFSLGTSPVVNNSGSNYVAYLFASNDGGFGAASADNVITCGSYSGTGAAGNTITLGYEPQWVMIKRTDTTSSWNIFDNMRGFVAKTGGSTGAVQANTTSAESPGTDDPYIKSTGFALGGANANFNAAGGVYVYVAIRRSLMKTPTIGSSVFGLNARAGTGANATVTGGQTDDAVIIKNRGSAVAGLFSSRLTGTGYVVPSSNAAELAAGATILQSNPWDVMDGVKVGTTSSITNVSTGTFINYLFRRAPGFFDVSCYTGTGAATTVNHNLSVAPELIIVKNRTTATSWSVYYGDATKALELQTTAAAVTSSQYWNNTSPTSSVFSVGISSTTNESGSNFISYLFATLSNISKVGSYTGTGATQTINCGFSSGARFVMIKRTDSTGDWYVWDTARGMVSGTDPSILLNSVAAEVNANSVYTTGVGFQIVSTVAGINASGGTYIYLAIA